MKTLQSHISESLFADGDINRTVKNINNSLVLSELPKTKFEYMNYLAAWLDTFNMLTLFEDNYKDGKDLAQYLVELYLNNLPNFSLNTSKLKQVDSNMKDIARSLPNAVPGDRRYSFEFDDLVVKDGKPNLNHDEQDLKKMIIAYPKEIASKRVDIICSILYGKLSQINRKCIDTILSVRRCSFIEDVEYLKYYIDVKNNEDVEISRKARADMHRWSRVLENSIRTSPYADTYSKIKRDWLRS